MFAAFFLKSLLLALSGELCYSALRWYLQQLRWPDVPNESLRGVTGLELTMDFEMATGLRLPGAAKHRVACDGSRWRRGATDGAVLAVGAVTTQGVTHQLEKIQGWQEGALSLRALSA